MLRYCRLDTEISFDRLFHLLRRQAKQFITEEKMASHFQGLRISSNYNCQNSVPSTSAISDPGGIVEPIEVERNDGSEQPRLIISEELKRLQEEPLIPISLLSKL